VSRVLVTGASGLIGARVGEALRNAGHDVTGLARRGIDGMIARDLTRPLCDVPPHDAVIHLAGAYAGASRRLLKRADLRMARNILAWGKANGVASWVFASAAEVYGDVGGAGSEASPLRPQIPYGEVKLTIERLFLRAAAENPGWRVVILRIGEVYGRDAKLVRELSMRLTRGLCPWPGSGRVPVSFVHVDDVAQAVVRCLDRAPAGVSIYNVADCKPTTWRGFLACFAERLGVPPPLYPPRPMVSAYAVAHSLSQRLAGREPVLTRYALRLLTTPKALSIDRIRRELGFTPRYPDIHTGLKDVLDGLPHHPKDAAAQGTTARASA
jgi:nucleoside-diphosphate-sugar epimerase